MKIYVGTEKIDVELEDIRLGECRLCSEDYSLLTSLPMSFDMDIYYSEDYKWFYRVEKCVRKIPQWNKDHAGFYCGVNYKSAKTCVIKES